MFAIEFAGFNELMSQNEELLAQISDPDKVLRMGVLNLQALISERIQQRGERTDGGEIGDGKGYSTRALKSFTGKDDAVAFGDFDALSTKKQKQRRAKAGKESDVFDGGYKEYRESLGRQTAYIDLTLTGDMLDRGFIAFPSGNDAFALGFINKLEADKMANHERRYGAIIQPSDSEEKEAFEHIFNSIQNAINKANSQG